jgi:hypothetical protein
LSRFGAPGVAIAKTWADHRSPRDRKHLKMKGDGAATMRRTDMFSPPSFALIGGKGRAEPLCDFARKA